ncbi:MAG: hypothetical protein IPK02_07090 [Candidatus Accumulibacter sp.]|uniref:Uncharacterized protein n=1 Tax=Candidatus Accumulibacter affinis TaxID=2954384 RepID=A0A935W7F1_9PROT|nr:hypothetical protein [Candidatus Accumulibacter affinis]
MAQVHAALTTPEMVQSVWDVVRAEYPEITEPEVVLPLRQLGQVEQLFPGGTPAHRAVADRAGDAA